MSQYLEGRFLGEEKYTNDKGYEVHNIIVLEDGQTTPKKVSAHKGFIAPKIDAPIKLTVGAVSFDSRVNKFNSKGVRYYSKPKSSKA